ncbi:MAG TPA: hypothetical protein VEB40_00605 [Flavipsychrobacter sp.]|nr:hypothetical protein [Flavipsychrobacter sp.]
MKFDQLGGVLAEIKSRIVRKMQEDVGPGAADKVIKELVEKSEAKEVASKPDSKNLNERQQKFLKPATRKIIKPRKEDFHVSKSDRKYVIAVNSEVRQLLPDSDNVKRIAEKIISIAIKGHLNRQ